MVTGAARGIGAATARRFAEEGAMVLVADRDGFEAEETAARLRGQGRTAQAWMCDVSDRASVEAAVAYAVGTYRCCRAALPHLAATGRGAIVDIGSVNGLQDFGNHAYSAAKALDGGLTAVNTGFRTAVRRPDDD